MLDWLLSSSAGAALGPLVYALLFVVAAVVVNAVRMIFKRPPLWPRWERDHVWPRWEPDGAPGDGPQAKPRSAK